MPFMSGIQAAGDKTCTARRLDTSLAPQPSFMDDALAEAAPARDADEVPVGCVVVRDGAVIARAGNRTLRDRDPTAHAEMLAIRRPRPRSAPSG